LFTTQILLSEEDKENKIKNNYNDIINYLKSIDLWNKETYNHKGFNKNLNELKSIKIQVKQIVSLYEFLKEDKNIEDQFLNNINNSEKEKFKNEDEVQKN